MKIRIEEPRDHARVREIHVRAFGRGEESVLVDALRKDPAWIPELSLVADESYGPIGHLLMTRLTIGGTGGAVSLAPMAVDPDHHRRGVGSALVTNALLVARSIGVTAVVVLGHPQYYPRFGFMPARSMGIDPPAGWDVPNDAWMALRLGEGSPTGVAAYPAAFDQVG